MTQKLCAGRLLALIIPLVFVGRPLIAMDAPAFDPDVDNIDSILKTMTWLPKSNLQPPVIDVTAFKVIDVPVDPAWQTADAFWQPGVPSQRGYITEVMVREGNLQPRPVKKRVGHWIEYDRDGRVLFEGSWNARSAMIGPHFFYFDPTQTPGLRVPRGEPLPLHKIEVYGACALDASQQSLVEMTKDASMSEQVWFYPTGELDSVTTYDAGQGTSATSLVGLRQMKWHPPVVASRQQKQPDLLASPFAQAVQEQRPQSAPAGPQLAEFAIQTSGENAERKTARYHTNGHQSCHGKRGSRDGGRVVGLRGGIAHGDG